MASLEAAQRASWSNIALGAAAASGARGRDLKLAAVDGLPGVA